MALYQRIHYPRGGGVTTTGPDAKPAPQPSVKTCWGGGGEFGGGRLEGGGGRSAGVGGSQGGGACARPTTTTFIPPGGMRVWGFGVTEVCM